jgi:hypothetical protein
MSEVHDKALEDIVKAIARFASESQFGSLEHAVSAYERICAARQKSLEGVALQPATPAVCNAPENNMQS